jgi:CHAT domain-containing protein/tetratricopeptide (TPR) repeat protein
MKLSLVSALTRPGAGLTNRHLPASLLFVACTTQVQAADSSEWLSPERWPHIHEASALPNETTLLLIEENGADLQIVLADGRVIESPGRRRAGQELLVLQPGEASRIQIAPVADKGPTAQVRVSIKALRDDAERIAVERLAAASIGANGSQADFEEACRGFTAVADDPSTPLNWLGFARYQAASCNIKAGLGSSAALVDSLAAVNEEVVVIRDYEVLWLQAMAAYVKDDYETAQRLFHAADTSAEQAAGAELERASAIKLDMLEARVYSAALTAILSYFNPGPDSNERLRGGEEQLRLVLAEAEALRDHTITGIVFDFLAAVDYIRGNSAGVIDNLLKAKAEIELTNQPLDLLTILGSIGDYYKNEGNPRRALEAYLEALAILEQYDRTADARAGDTYDNLGTLYFTLGDFPRAGDFMRRAIAIAQKAGSDWRAQMISVRLAEVLEQQGDMRAAAELSREAHAFFAAQQETWSPYRIWAQTTYSRLARAQGEVALALQLSRELLANLDAGNLPTSNMLVPLYVNHAWTLHETGESTEAVKLLETTLTDTAMQPVDRIAVLDALHELYAQAGNEAGVLAAAEAAFDVIESQQMEIESARLGPYWSGRNHVVYARHVDYWLNNGVPDVQRAFSVSERARASNLRLRRQAALREQDFADPTLEALWQEMLAAIQQEASPQSEADSLEVERKIALARERYFAAHGEALKDNEARDLSLTTVAAALPDDAMLVQFLASPKEMWRLDLQRGQWALTKLGAIEQVSAMVDAVRFELSSASNRQQNLRALSGLLLRDFAPAPGITSVLVSPDEAMHAVPFAALHFGNGYLGEAAALTLVPSISQYLVANQDRARQHALELAVLADPAFGALTVPAAYGDAPDTFRSWSTRMQRLPASAVEAEALSSYFEESKRMVFTGANATQRNFFSDAVRNANIIHVATHGYFNDAMPELVGLVMASDDGDDGFVSMAEISMMKFAADLVVISACSTGQGELIPGEGNISLARTFLAQGVNSVISTLWPVSDRATALFMKEFYRSLKVDGASYDIALQSAQRLLQGDPQYRNPYYWGAFTLTSVVPVRDSAR